MSKAIVTASPADWELGPEVVPIIPSWVLSGAPETHVKSVLRSHDSTCDLAIWECNAGSFNWHYSQDETVVIISGEVFVTNETGEERRLGPGDLAFFPAGSSSRWRVPVHVRKIAVLRETLWRPLGLGLRAWKKLLRIAGLRRQSPF
ncbi:MAG TPA: cupin domain-containing protein [Bryobacteraceae bacterium]|jgi:hypothetical protein